MPTNMVGAMPTTNPGSNDLQMKMLWLKRREEETLWLKRKEEVGVDR